MKYRIRDTETGKIDSDNRLILDRDGDVVFIDGYGDIRISRLHKAEMEVADGVYVGDYLLTDIFGSQHVLEIKSSFEAVEVRTGMSLEVNLCQKEHYEVIKCR